MRSRWIWWSLSVCAVAAAAYAATTAYADSRRARSHGVAKRDKPGARADARQAKQATGAKAPARRLAEAKQAEARRAEAKHDRSERSEQRARGEPHEPGAPDPQEQQEPKEQEQAADAPPAKARTKAQAKAEAKRKADEELAKLTDDPLLARADQIDGSGVRNMVAFTFDDGPNAETTPHVLEALHKYDVPATFFVVTRRLVGRLAEQNRAVLARAVEGGFVIASHSVSHTNLKTLSKKALGREIDQSVRVLAKEAGRPVGLFRAPFGALDERSRAHLKKRGLTEVKWSIDTIDWHERDGEKLRKRALATILRQEGGVVLMHDAKEVTARSLALLLDDLEDANCQRLADKQEPVLPVSLHYWLRDDGKPRAVPEEVQKRTAAYRAALPSRCAARAVAEELAEQTAQSGRPVAKASRARRARR